MYIIKYLKKTHEKKTQIVFLMSKLFLNNDYKSFKM
jgi:hypothetical protein